MKRQVTFQGAGQSAVSAWYWEPAGGLGDEPAPAVLLVHEVFGLDPNVAAVGDALAGEGWHVLAPDLYSRTGRPGPEPSADQPAPRWELDAIRAAVGGLPDRQALEDLQAGLGWLVQEAGCDPERRVAWGYCMGGTLALLLGCRSHGLAAVVSYYGKLVYGELSQEKPVEPLEMILGLEVPLLAHFGDQDSSIPQEHIEELRTRLSAFAKPFEIEVHAGAGHGFANLQRPSGHPESERRAQERSLAFLHEILDESE